MRAEMIKIEVLNSERLKDLEKKMIVSQRRDMGSSGRGAITVSFWGLCDLSVESVTAEGLTLPKYQIQVYVLLLKTFYIFTKLKLCSLQGT